MEELELRHIIRWWYNQRLNDLMKRSSRPILVIKDSKADVYLHSYDLSLEYNTGVLSRLISNARQYDILLLLEDDDIQPDFFRQYSRNLLYDWLLEDFGLKEKPSGRKQPYKMNRKERCKLWLLTS